MIPPLDFICISPNDLWYLAFFIYFLDICILSDLCITGSFCVFVYLKILLCIPALPGTHYEVQTDLVLMATIPSGCQDHRCVPPSPAIAHFNYGLFGLFLLLSCLSSLCILNNNLNTFQRKVCKYVSPFSRLPFFFYYSVGCFLDCTEFPNLRWFICHL